MDCLALAERFGTPLYVLSEGQIRTNARAMLHAFRSRYPKTEVLFSNKANNNPAVRSIFNAEGCGGDCFGFGELHLSLLVGSDPDTIMLNGSNKQAPELELAIQAGVTINLDSLEELDMVSELAQRLDRRARVAPRTRLTAPRPRRRRRRLACGHAGWTGRSRPQVRHAVRRRPGGLSQCTGIRVARAAWTAPPRRTLDQRSGHVSRGRLGACRMGGTSAASAQRLGAGAPRRGRRPGLGPARRGTVPATTTIRRLATTRTPRSSSTPSRPAWRVTRGWGNRR